MNCGPLSAWNRAMEMKKMQEDENSPSSEPLAAGDGPIKRKYQGVCIKCYFSEEGFSEVAALAEKAGSRRGGTTLYTLRPHGFAEERQANTDGIAKFLKLAAAFWAEHQPELDLVETEVKEKTEYLRRHGRMR